MNKLNINSLVSSLEEVKAISSPYKRSLKWFSISFILMLFITYLIKVFTNQALFKYSISFYLESAGLLIIAYCAILSAFLYSSPDEFYQKRAKQLSIFSALSWILIFTYCLYHCYETGHFIHMMLDSFIDYKNFIQIALIGIAPTIWLIFMLRKAFPTNKQIIGALSILGSLTIAIVCSKLLDQNHEAIHMLIWRYTPVLILAVLSYWFSDRMLSR